MPAENGRLVVLLALLATACSAGPVVQCWPAADRLFRSDPQWRGGDAAYAVPLGGDRTLWLFGDSFVAPRPGDGPARRRCTMVRNSIALQRGGDPATAGLQFAWGGRDEADAAPRDWLPPDGAAWMWPLHGLCCGDSAVVFATRVESTGGGDAFAFRAAGWRAFVLRGLDGAIGGWTRIPAQLPPPLPFAAVVGTAVVEDGDRVYAFALREPGDHAVFLLRWPRALFAAGDLRRPEWRQGERWVDHSELREAPTPVLVEGAPEFTVLRHGSGFAMVQSQGFGCSNVVVRTAPTLWGPWSAATPVFHPPESDDPAVLTYAAKATASTDGSWLLTYASNTLDLGRLVDDERLYYPHCLRLWPDRLLP